MLLCLLVTLPVATILALRARGRRAGHADVDWLPVELRGATLMWTEKEFRCSDPVPMVARIDRAYRGHDGSLTLVEFKRRSACHAYPSDVVELSVQRYVLQESGHAVNRLAYVVIVPAGGGRPRALTVQLEDGKAVERRAMRLLAVRNGKIHPARGRAPRRVSRLRSPGHLPTRGEERAHLTAIRPGADTIPPCPCTRPEG